MADNTKIEWADATVNAINGCTVTSPGCTNCYAMKLAGTRMKTHPTRAGLTQDSKGGPVWTGEVRFNEAALLQPLRWRRPRRIFWNAHGDTFHDAVPDEWIDRIFSVAADTPQHIHMILTKRSARMLEYMQRWKPAKSGHPKDPADHWPYITRDGVAANKRPKGEKLFHTSEVRWPLPNVWLGVSVEDQARADERIPDLLATPAAVRFLSCEPLLGPVILEPWLAPWKFCQECDDGEGYGNRCGNRSIPRAEQCPWTRAVQIQHEHGPFSDDGEPSTITSEVRTLDWVIAGGESGPSARPMHPDWARSLRDQCAEAGAPFHFKQWGEWAPAEAVANEHGGVDFVPPLPMTGLLRWRRWDGESCRSARSDESVNEFFEPGVLAVPVGKRAAGRLLDGVEHNGMPGA